ncbi:MAG: hypothetical protein CBB87_04300 [Micavibrio sp. TMED27]|nr:hypothetical protein [Micavibrio sp.]OUT91257.1 MAG: hypothetical protein CBB87_04300 [Micavibrio sp. TMED27]|tara:strand:- start:499 stop:990 length:492 start_codon:yes stop_codon:yes gene_type:complete
MRETLPKLLHKLAVSHLMSAYETMPWVHYDDVHGLTCSAEVRMGPGEKDLEAEIQMLKDDENASGPDQILWMHAEPVSDGMWSPLQLRVCGENYVNVFHGWEQKGCDFFRSTVESLQMGIIPDFEALVNQYMVDDTGGGRSSGGRIGRKAPKASNNAVMGMKK